MSRLICRFQVLGPVQTNCYYLYREDTKECVIVDPAAEADRIREYVDKQELKPVAILLTHGHFDHIMAVDAVRTEYQIPVYAAEAERETLTDPRINLGTQMGSNQLSVEADHWLADGEEIELLGQPVRCLLTPGHTVGGMCYYFPKAAMLFSGDTLFQESVGRTDFPGGSMSELIRSIREKLFVLPEAVQVFPGHGLTTSIQNEKMFNPFAVE
ncbi:MAG: MBL fold metallo-hydrolase [Eubacteriales bacterium]|nr:MBL fold metallo-hydrolase [Eubacteriales bacterium]